MTQSEKYIILVVLTVATGGFLLGFDAMFISGTGPFIQKYFDLTGVSGGLKLGWSSLLSYGLPSLAALLFVIFVHRIQPQPAVILERLPSPQRRLPSAGAKE